MISSTVNVNIEWLQRRGVKKSCLISIFSPDVRHKAATRQFFAQFGKNCIVTTHIFQRGSGKNFMEPKIYHITTVSLKTHCGNERKHILVKMSSLFSIIYCEHQGKKRWNEAATYTEINRYWLRGFTFNSFELYQR